MRASARDEREPGYDRARMDRGSAQDIERLAGLPLAVFVVADARIAAVALAAEIAELLAAPRGAVLGFATGHSPRALYRELVRRHCEEGLSFARATSFNLDEYYGLAP